jgi:hypothetical protein
MLPDHDLLEIRAGTLKLKGTTDGTRFVTIVLDRHSHLSDQLKVLRESSSRTVCKTRVREQHTTDDANRKEKVGIDEQRESTEKRWNVDDVWDLETLGVYCRERSSVGEREAGHNAGFQIYRFTNRMQ